MIMMPLGPQFMRLFAIGPQAFGLLVSAYTFAAAAAASSRRSGSTASTAARAARALFADSSSPTALCGIAPTILLLLARADRRGPFRRRAGRPHVRRSSPTRSVRRRATATAVVSPSFSLRRVAGVPLSLLDRGPFRGARLSVLAAFSVLVGLAAAAAHSFAAAHRRAPGARLARRRSSGHLRRAQPPARVRAHDRADVLGLHVVPFIAPTTSPTSASSEADLAVIYFAGGLPLARHGAGDRPLADRYGKKRCSRSSR
jgi:predicted MFS family arabinose efflux permease